MPIYRRAEQRGKRKVKVVVRNEIENCMKNTEVVELAIGMEI